MTTREAPAPAAGIDIVTMLEHSQNPAVEKSDQSGRGMVELRTIKLYTPVPDG